MKISDLSLLDLAADPREVLGDTVPFFFYRYVTLFAIAEASGARAQQALEAAGRRVGEQIVKGMFYHTLDDVVAHYRQHGMGILTVEEQGSEFFRLRLDECATCAGLPNVDMALCYFDGGILAGAIQALLGPPADAKLAYRAEEVACVGMGGHACIFEIGPRAEAEEE